MTNTEFECRYEWERAETIYRLKHEYPTEGHITEAGSGHPDGAYGLGLRYYTYLASATRAHIAYNS